MNICTQSFPKLHFHSCLLVDVSTFCKTSLCNCTMSDETVFGVTNPDYDVMASLCCTRLSCFVYFIPGPLKTVLLSTTVTRSSKFLGLNDGAKIQALLLTTCTLGRG